MSAGDTNTADFVVLILMATRPIRRRALALAGFLFFMQQAVAQPGFEWARAAGAAGDEGGNGIIVDAHGNSYTTGYCGSSVDMDPGPGVHLLNSTQSRNAYILKLDSAGNFVWAALVCEGAYSEGFSIKVDAQGNVFSTGMFQGTGDFDPGPGTFSITATNVNKQNVYISKLDSNGHFVWAKHFAGSGQGMSYGYSIALDDSANVYTTGYFRYTTDFDPGTATFNITASNTGYDVFISKLDSAGNFVWAKCIDATTGNLPVGFGVAVDNSGYVYAVGYFGGTYDFDPGPGVHTLTASGAYDGFVLRLDPNGNYTWAFKLGGAGSDRVTSITVDAAKNVYITGLIGGTTDFDPGIGVYNLVPPPTANSVFVARYNAIGQFVWAKMVGSVQVNNGMGICSDPMGNVYVTGYFSGTGDFDPGSGVYQLIASGGTYDYEAFVLKLTATGAFSWAANMGGMSHDLGFSIAIDPAGNVYSTGNYASTPADFDPGAAVFNLSAAGTIDLYVHKLNQCLTPPAPLNTTASGNMIMCPGNSTTLTASGFGAIGWYSAATGGTYLGGGNSFTTSLLNATTTYYVQDSLCTASDSLTAITVTISPSPYVAISVTDTFVCPGQSTVLTGIGGTSYSWNPGALTGTSVTASPLTTTTYTLSATGGPGCTVPGIDTITITIYPQPVVGITATPSTSLCSGDTMRLQGTGATTYSWSGGISDGVAFVPPATTAYTVTGTDQNGCTDTATVQVHVNPLPVPVANATTNFVCLSGGQVALNGSPAGGLWSGNGVSGNAFDPMAAGAGTWTATYAYTDSNGCSASDTVNITVDVCTGIADEHTAPPFMLSPVTNNTIALELHAQQAMQVQVHTASGTLVKQLRLQPGVRELLQIDTAGVYLITFTGDDGNRFTRRVVITH